MTTTAIVSNVFMAIFLLACAWLDVKTRKVPNVLTFMALGYGLLAASLRGNWPAALLVVLYILLSDLPKPIASPVSLLALGIAGILSWRSLGLDMSEILIQVMMFVIWQMWLQGLTGGADAKLLLALTLLYGSGVFLAAVLAGGVFGLVALLLKKRTLPYVLPIAAGTIVFMALKITQLI